MNYTYPILAGVIAGVFIRLTMLRTDYRQYPSYLHGKIIHVALGFIAAALGAVAVPSILDKDFTAVTFLTVAASQFRDVRNMERTTLTQLDQYELVSRGSTYIEGIALVYESRNYLVIFTSFFTCWAYVIGDMFGNEWIGVVCGIVTAVICFLLSHKLMTGSRMREIADVKHGRITFKDAGLYVDDIYIMNIGLEDRRNIILEHGMGFIVEPHDSNARVTLGNIGQRQAILHDCTVALGVYRDTGNPALVPLAKRDNDDGRLAVFILPIVRDIETVQKIIENVPVLDNAVRQPNKKLMREGAHND